MDKRLSELFNEIYTPICDLDVTAYITHEPVPYGERTTGERSQQRNEKAVAVISGHKSCTGADGHHTLNAEV